MSFDEKNEFYKKLDVYYKNKPGKRPYSIDEINSMIQSLIEAKLNKNKKTRREYYLLEKFDVLNIAEKHFLISKQKDKNNEEIKYIVAYEELYERINDYHIRTGHGGNVKLRMAVANKYNIPRPAIEFFLSTCAIYNCKKNMNRKLVVKPIISKDFNERGQVDLVDFQSVPDGKFKWILNYQDHSTKFLSLRPLESKRASEVANNLLAIFLTFGAPKILQSDNGREFVNSIIVELKELWPDCVIVHGRPRHPQSQGSIERSNQDIENMLRAWMKDNNTKKWSVGLQFVQFQKNSSHHRVIGRSPYKALFGNDPKIGLATSNLPLEILQKLVTEEDLEEICNEEIEKITAECNVCGTECCVETDSAEAILCNICETNIKINEARHLGAAGIEKQAEKMLQDSKTKTPEFKVGDCVVIPVPKVDRGLADPVNIVAVVIDQKNDLNRLGTEQSIIKGWYGSGNIQLATSRFIDIKQVNKVKEMSLREIVSSLTGGQGFFSCHCKGKC